jgi:hypothetical protein
VRYSSCPWTHIRSPVVPGSLVWRGARSSSGSRYKVRRDASLAQSIAGTGVGRMKHIGRVDTAGLARYPASSGSARQAAHPVGSETCMRPTLRDAAPLPSQWNVSPDVRGGGWALSAANRAYRSSADITSSWRLSMSSQWRERPSTIVPHVSRVPKTYKTPYLEVAIGSKKCANSTRAPARFAARRWSGLRTTQRGRRRCDGRDGGRAGERRRRSSALSQRGNARKYPQNERNRAWGDMSPRGGAGSLGGAVDFPIVFCYMFCYTGKHCALVGSDRF